MENKKNRSFFKYILIFLIVVFCLFFPACNPDGFEVQYVIVGSIPGVPTHDGIIRYAENCTVWDNSNQYTVNDSCLEKVIYYYDRFVAVGSMQGTYYSLDGITWTRGNTAGCGIFWDVDGGESNTWSQPWVAHYVAVGTSGMVYFSINGGIDWNPASNNPTNQSLYAVAFGTVIIQGISISRFVAVGALPDQASDIPQTATIIWSQDGGDNWFAATSGLPSHTLCAVGSGSNRFVAAGTGATIVYSDNGAGWNAATVLIPEGNKAALGLMGVAYGNGKWVAVGGLSSILYSIDGGMTWQYATSPPNMGNYGIADVVFDGSKFVAVGYNASYEGVVIESSNGITWSLSKYFAPSLYYYTGIGFKPN